MERDRDFCETIEEQKEKKKKLVFHFFETLKIDPNQISKYVLKLIIIMMDCPERLLVFFSFSFAINSNQHRKINKNQLSSACDVNDPYFIFNQSK